LSVEENNKALVRRFVEEVLNGGNLDAIDELMAPDYLDHGTPTGKYAGREGHKRSIAKQLAASSDLRFHIEEQIAEGDKVVSWVIGSGTHDRERFMGLAPTGTRITMEYIYGQPRSRRKDRGREGREGCLTRVAAAPPTREDRTRATWSRSCRLPEASNKPP
jgi:predicted ester cyclase